MSKDIRFSSLLLIIAFFCMGFSPSGYFYTKKGNQFYREKNYGEAEKYYRKAQLKDPASPEINYNLGNIHYQNGELEKAIAEYAKVVEGENEELKKSSLYNLGNSLYKTGSAVEATSDTNKAVEALKGAVEAYKNSLALDEKDVDVKHNLNLAEEKLQKLVQQQKKEEEKKEQKDDKNKEKKEQDKKEDGEKDKEQKPEQDQEQQKDEGTEKKENEEKKEEDPEKGEQEKESQEKDDKKEAGEPKDQKQGAPKDEKNIEGISKKEAEAILDALKGEENELQKAFRLKNSKGGETNVRQDW